MKKIDQCIRANNALNDLAKQGETLITLQKVWLSLVPASLKQHTIVANLRQNQLVVYAYNNAVAAKLKLLAPNLLESLKKQEVEVTSISVKVQVKSFSIAPKKPLRHISRQGAQHLSDFADKLGNTPLASKLKKLAQQT